MFWTIVGAIIFVALLPSICKILFYVFVGGLQKLENWADKRTKNNKEING